MTGGGIKALLPGPSQLSIPTVVGGGEYQVSVPGTAEVAENGVYTDKVVAEATFVNQRLAPCPLETRVAKKVAKAIIEHKLIEDGDHRRPRAAARRRHRSALNPSPRAPRNPPCES